MIAGSRWGPERVSVVALHEGKIVKQSELTVAVRRLVQADFRKSRASHYNDYYDFVFAGGYSSHGEYVNVPEDSKHQGWDLDDTGLVRIDCVCTTDPKNIDPRG